MQANPKFTNCPKAFWATVRSVSQKIGYSKKGQVTVPTLAQIQKVFQALKLNPHHIITNGNPTSFALELIEYFKYRADVLNTYVEPRLMDAARAKNLFEKLRSELNPSCPIPMNKQKGTKKAPAFLTAIVNMLIESNADGLGCDYDPTELTTITKDDLPLRTLARRVDGTFPSAINPVAIWEIKEYYYTTTFGSRVADGVYETLLDGMELEELREHEGIHVFHCLILDAYYTWWDCGKSYLCRIIDMLNMGYADEVLFGYEVVERLPELVKNWGHAARQRP